MVNRALPKPRERGQRIFFRPDELKVLLELLVKKAEVDYQVGTLDPPTLKALSSVAQAVHQLGSTRKEAQP